MKLKFLALSAFILASCEGGNLVSIDASSLIGNTTTSDEIFRKISASRNHACALMYSGDVRCWGLGDNRELGRVLTISVSAVASAVPGLSGVTSVAVGEKTSCAATVNAIYCWGSNAYGSLGTGSATTVKTETPQAVTGWSSLASAPILAGGYSHYCAVNATSGAASCWGKNTDGYLGDGTTTDRATPVAVSGASSGVTAIGAASSGSHSCAIISGALKCWGYGASGQLGNGSTTTSSVPVAVTGVTGVSKVALGGAHSCALTAGGDVYCWGNAEANGAAVDLSTATKVSGIAGATDIAAGTEHSCALVGGAVKCWGSNSWGQLGNGTTGDSITPVTVNGLATVSSIAAGGNFSCAVTDSGSAYCWGDNNYGQLGNSAISTSSSKIPVQVRTD